jgi:uncharacterized protein YndB with AHSA1/START domain
MQFTKTILIHAPPERVWEFITRPALIRQWLADFEVEVSCEQKEGGIISFTGCLHDLPFTDRGVILDFVPFRLFRHTFYSSVSNRPDVPANHSLVEFRLVPCAPGTALTYTHSRIQTEVDLNHVALYWNTTLHVLKSLAETAL